MVRDPRVVFDSLFGVGATPGERRERRAEDKSLLDWLSASVEPAEEATWAPRTAPGSTDYLDRGARGRAAHPEGRGVQQQRRARELPGAPIGVPDSFSEHVKLMFDLQALAFASDVTRVFAFKLGRDASNRTYPESGFNGAFHSTSHHGERENTILEFARINTYHVGMIPYFLEKLKNTPDGDGTLLDNTLVIYGSPMGDSHVHNHKRCPLFLAGHAGGRLKGGLHVRAADGTPMANVMLTVLHTLGLDDMTSVWRQHRRVRPDQRAGARRSPPPGVARWSRRDAAVVHLRAEPRLGAMLATAAAVGRAERAAGRRGRARRHRARSRRCSAQAADVNAPQGDGMTALHWAAMRNDTRAGRACCCTPAPTPRPRPAWAPTRRSCSRPSRATPP